MENRMTVSVRLIVVLVGSIIGVGHTPSVKDTPHRVSAAQAPGKKRVILATDLECRITGHVVADDDDSPISGIQVRLVKGRPGDRGSTWPVGEAVYTGKNGSFIFRTKPGRYTLSVLGPVKDYYAPSRFDLLRGEYQQPIRRTLLRGFTKIATLEPGENVVVEFRLGKGLVIAGIVRDADGNPVPKAVAERPGSNNGRVLRRTATTTADGRFELSGFPPDRPQRIQVSAAEPNLAATIEVPSPRSKKQNRIDVHVRLASTLWDGVLSRAAVESEMQRIAVSVSTATESFESYQAGLLNLEVDAATLLTLVEISRRHPDPPTWITMLDELPKIGSRIRNAAKSRSRDSWLEARGAAEAFRLFLRREAATKSKKIDTESNPFSELVAREDTMKRIARWLKWSKQNIDNQESLAKHATRATHEAELVAALISITGTAGFDSADEAEFRKHIESLRTSMIAVRESARSNDYESFQKAKNIAVTACAACHSEYR